MRRGATALLLVVAGLVGVTTVAQAQMVLGSCPANSNWSATWTVGYESNVVGEFFHFDPNTGLGGLDPATIPYGLSVFTVEQILRTRVANTDSLSFRVSGGELPDGTVLSFGGMELTVDADSDTTTDGREQWSLFNLGLNPTWVAGQEMRVCADLPPGLVSATVDGTSLVLDYDQALDTGSVPDEEDDYTVTVNGIAVTVSSVSVSGTEVTLTLEAAVIRGRTVTVSYEAPSSGAVRDGSDIDAPSFSDQQVNNVSAVTNSSATGQPAVEGVAAVGKVLKADIDDTG